MAILIILIFVSCILITRNLVRDKISKFCIYCYLLYWNISLFVSTFQPFGIQEIQDTTYYILILGMLSFFLGMICTNRFCQPKYILTSNIHLFTLNTRIITSPILLSTYTLCTIFALRFAKNALRAAAISGEALMSDNRFEKIFEGSAMGSLTYNYILTPLFYITLSLVLISLFNKNNRPKLFYCLSAVFLISYFILAGGRALFVIVLMYIAITYICIKSTKNRYNVSKKTLIIGGILTLFVLLGMSLQTAYRTTGKYSISTDEVSENISEMGELFATYSIVPIKLFDVALKNDIPEKFNGFKYGRATIAGTDEIVCGVVRRITGTRPWSTSEIVKYTQDTWIKIIPGKWGYNYCYTALFYNYMDFGILGVIFFPFIFGAIFQFFIIQFSRYRTLPTLILVSFGFYMMLHSLFQCYFIKNWVLLYCICLVIWNKYTIRQLKLNMSNPIHQ